MRFSVVNLVVAILAALSGTAASMGMSTTSFKRDLALAAQLGISPDVLLSQGKSVHKAVKERVHHNVTTEWATVWLLSRVFILTY